jgi:hypothetical protein
MRVIQVDYKGRNVLVKDFLDELERLGVECKLETQYKNGNEVHFVVRTRKTDEDLKKLKKAMASVLLAQDLLE